MKDNNSLAKLSNSNLICLNAVNSILGDICSNVTWKTDTFIIMNGVACLCLTLLPIVPS